MPYTRLFFDPSTLHGPFWLGIRVDSTADHHLIKRRPMSHPDAKSLYLSASGEPAIAIGDWLINLPNGRVIHLPKEEAEALQPQPLPEYVDPRSHHEPRGPLPTPHPPVPPAAPNDITASESVNPSNEESPP